MFGTALALILTTLRTLGLHDDLPWLDRVLHFILISAEAIEYEIFHYRAQAGNYSDQQIAERKTSREAKLTRQVETISRQLMQTEVDLSALRPYTGLIWKSNRSRAH